MSITKTLVITDLSTITKHEDILRGRTHAPSEDAIRTLADKIKASGQLQPCGVTENNGQYTLVFGSTRYEAVQLLQEEGEKIGLWVSVLSEKDALENFQASIDENTVRTELSPIDQLGLIKHLKSVHKVTKGKDIAERLGVTSAWVTQLNKLSKLNDAHQMLVHDKVLPVQAGIDLTKIKDDEVREEVLSKAKTNADGVYSGSDVSRRVEAIVAPEVTDTEDNGPVDTTRSMGAFMDFIEDNLVSPEDVEKELKDFASKCLKWCRGKAGDKALCNAFDTLLNATATEIDA